MIATNNIRALINLSTLKWDIPIYFIKLFYKISTLNLSSISIENNCPRESDSVKVTPNDQQMGK